MRAQIASSRSDSAAVRLSSGSRRGAGVVDPPLRCRVLRARRRRRRHRGSHRGPRKACAFQRSRRETRGFWIVFMVRHAAELNAEMSATGSRTVTTKFAVLARRRFLPCDEAEIATFPVTVLDPVTIRSMNFRSSWSPPLPPVFSTSVWRRRNTKTRVIDLWTVGKPAFGVYAPNERARDPNAPPPGPGAGRGR